jgi:hypothetical protein
MSYTDLDTATINIAGPRTAARSTSPTVRVRGTRLPATYLGRDRSVWMRALHPTATVKAA